MIENKCVNTLEPEATLAEMNKQGYRLVSAISQFAGMLLFFERVNEKTVTHARGEFTEQEKANLMFASLQDNKPQPAKGKRK